MTVTRRAVLGGGAGLGIVALGGIGLSRFLRSSAPDADVHAVLFDPDQPVLGNPQGDVTVAEFFDYQCPFCKRGHDDLMAEVEADGNLRLIMKDWPIFGGASVIAAQMVLGGVASDDYLGAQAALMATPARLSEDDVRSTLSAAGLDPDVLLGAYGRDRARWDGMLGRNAQQAAGLGLQGTPAFIVERTIHAGAMDRTALRRAIAAARATD
ncbi:DsbA family protein [Paracoccus gahaiensis]|uniref:DsbA family protein n=1 Tax=Paracoccus gahaiensis TaxID=1706839 RepID=A0A4U0R515_9RHOB|nr:DsbA family protein [Paracoccus gahaiensis]TJZ89925.1 DsbA family protein [Paracoccus gahaiensis]